MYDEYEAQFLHKAWQILQDISDQLAHNNQFAGSLRQHAERLKGDATQFAQGFPLRRYNVDLTKETFESDLERASAQLIVENHGLSHENAQLGHLLKEFEHTLETVMQKFRAHTQAATIHEQALLQYYERRLELAAAAASPQPALPHPAHIARLARTIRTTLAAIDGKEPDELPDERIDSGIEMPAIVIDTGVTGYPPNPYPSTAIPIDISPASPAPPAFVPSHSPIPPHALPSYSPALASSRPAPARAPRPKPEPARQEEQDEEDDEAEESDDADADPLPWHLAREAEITRLREENARLRSLLKIDETSLSEAGIPDPAPPPLHRYGGSLSGGLVVAAPWANGAGGDPWGSDGGNMMGGGMGMVRPAQPQSIPLTQMQAMLAHQAQLQAHRAADFQAQQMAQANQFHQQLQVQGFPQNQQAAQGQYGPGNGQGQGQGFLRAGSFGAGRGTNARRGWMG
ncbi:unnamed protein product [Peniophora sp. CBMAI 1063]|nr:unnamed protein product [Peniophora sp. CBMAI 1063]